MVLRFYLLTLRKKTASIVDDNSFPEQGVSVTLPKFQFIIGCSHGLLCVYAPRDGPDSFTGRVLIFNPCIRRKAVDVVVNGVGYWSWGLGFGVCPETKDPKFVKITLTTSPWQAAVFTLSTRAWRCPYSTNLPRNLVRSFGSQVYLDGALYWLACDKVGVPGVYNLIVSFDLTSEEFRLVNLLDSLAPKPICELSMHKLRESVVVIETGLEDSKYCYHVWMMEGDVTKSFKKLYTITNRSSDLLIVDVRGFRKTGEPLVEVYLRDHHGYTSMLAAYDPYSKSIANVGISGISFSLYSYTDTLLCFDQPVFTSAFEGYRQDLVRL
ncbi:putative F-box associated interaction domain-containing protein [Helianthus debilis subsp. tardiflorus]